MDFKKVIATKEFQAFEHAVKVAGFVAASAFVSSIALWMTNSPTLAQFIANHPQYAIVFTLVNMALAYAVKYVNLHKAEVEGDHTNL